MQSKLNTVTPNICVSTALIKCRINLTRQLLTFEHETLSRSRPEDNVFEPHIDLHLNCW